MKAIDLPAYGLDNLRLTERPLGQPGAGQVLVRIKAVSLNYRDLLTVQGAYGGNYRLPLVPCSDGAGEVAAVGPGVTRVAAGDRVAPLFFQSWIGGRPTRSALASALGGALDGCLQEYMLLSQEGVARVPDFLSDAEAACLPCAALTAWRALVADGGLKAGETVLVQGTGGVSIFALQFAKAAGAEVIITSSSDAKLARAKALGADHLINYRHVPKWSSTVREITGGLGVDHVVEVGGAETLQEALKSVRVGGHIAVIGVLTGPAKDLMLPFIIGTNVRIQGLSVGSREQFEDMARAIALHRIRPVIDRHFPFGEAKEALGLMASQSHFGKIVIDGA